MAIQQLTMSIWSDASCTSKVLHDPKWEQIAEAITSLDGRARDEVYLVPSTLDPETYLCIGGGAGRYIVTGSLHNETFPTLVDRSRAEHPQVELVCGGQAGRYPGNWIVDAAEALQAARDFFEAGGFDGSTPWAEV